MENMIMSRSQEACCWLDKTVIIIASFDNSWSEGHCIALDTVRVFTNMNALSSD